MPTSNTASACNEFALRQAIVEPCRSMNTLGINQGTSGNISVRWPDALLTTPSGVLYAEMSPDDTECRMRYPS